MTDYNKLKVADLKELLSQRQLPTTGKKEELITRLTADDTAKASSGDPDPAPASSTTDPTPAVPALSVEQEVKADTATDTSSSAPVNTASEASIQGEKKKFAFKRLADEFDKPAEEPVAKSAEKPEEAKPEETKAAEAAEAFTAGLASSTANLELEKRKKRAARFGVPVSDSIKLMERAKRFGAEEEDSSKVGNKTLQILDSALGENRGKKRGPETRIQNEPPKKTKDASKPASSAGVLSDPAEKAKAEARAKRFGGS